jgi:hypothetical protein
MRCWVPVAHTYNSSYLEGRNQEDHGTKPTQANNFQDPTSKIFSTKRTGRVAQVVEQLLSKHKAPSSSPSSIKNFF